MNLKSEIESYIKKKSTILCIGPMSKNCIDSTIKLSDKYNILLMLIASRRQIDSAKLGGGYVENWDTVKFSRYVKKKSIKKKVVFCRDHAGPWQNNLEIEKKLNINEAMKSAKESLAEDIDNDFKILHLDPSVNFDSKKTVSKKKILNRLFELMDFCHKYSIKRNKKIFFEVGTEEQSGGTNTPEEIEFYLSSIIKFCNKTKIQKPLFTVVQTGTKVLEMGNYGSFESELRIKNEIAPEIQIFKALEICKKFGIWIKEHNSDYLSNDSLSWHPKIGIHAVNVAPEFGVCETKALDNILKQNGLTKQRERFLNISYNSGKWKKWLRLNSSANDYEKSLIAGHYIFSNIDFLDLKKEILFILDKKSINLDIYLQEEISKSILRYIQNFRLLN
jgi:hypothetical protein